MIPQTARSSQLVEYDTAASEINLVLKPMFYTPHFMPLNMALNPYIVTEDQRKLASTKPWTKNPTYFSTVHISMLAALKMVQIYLIEGLPCQRWKFY